MKRFSTIAMAFFLSVGCSQEELPSPKKIPVPTEMSEKVAPKSTPDLDAGERARLTLEAARKVRQKETQKFGSMTQDAVTPVDACFIQEELRVPTSVGVVHVPYDSGPTFFRVAREASEHSLQGTKPEPGCSRREAIYWCRDQDGGGDFAYRVPVEAGQAPSLWWVPDEGSPRAAQVDEIQPRVYVDRLLKVAGTKADVDHDYELALVLVKRAMELDPSNKRGAGVRTELIAMVHPPTAVAELRTFMDSYGDNAELRATLASALLDVKTATAQEEADELLAQILSQEPTHIKALSLRAERLGDEGNFAESAALYEKLIGLNSAIFMAHYGAATAYLSLGKKEEALGHLNRYLSVDKTDADALYLRARTLLELGKLAEARRDVKALRKQAPDAPEVDRLEVEILAAARKL